MKAPNLAIAVVIAAAIAASTAFGEARAASGLAQPNSQGAASAQQAGSNLMQPDAYNPVDYRYANASEESAESSTCDCDQGSCDACNTCGCDDCSDWDYGGWIQQGVTFNGYDPDDRFNGVVGLNDRANDYQMNQFWLYVAREADTGGCGWDYGGRVDFVYGTDAQFFQMVDGLEEDWEQHERFYQVALLRFYYDIAYNDWTLRMGRWDAPVGYEPYEATEGFFYSKSYNFMVQPGSLFGVLLTRKLNDQLSVSGGIHRGSDQFDDSDGKDAIDFVGGGSWMSCDEDSWLDAYVIAEEKGPGNDTLHYSVAGGTMLTDCVEYVAEWYYGSSNDYQQAEWYGLNQHLMRTINDCWAYGVRFEWFRDDDGFMVGGFRDGNVADGAYVGDFYELTFAVNYTPRENFAVRPEIRWDWYKSDNGGDEPFNDETRSNQFIASIDAVWAF